ncbi:MAG: heme-binding protein, partial [Gemmataceae bacterium]|nr:heme-binding protein [Gemmataceae bacterium]
AFTSVFGFAAFHPAKNFRAPTNPANQNGVVFFPGASGVYKAGALVGGFGVSGDGVDQDDVVASFGIKSYAPAVRIRVDQFSFRGVRLPYFKFPRNPER